MKENEFKALVKRILTEKASDEEKVQFEEAISQNEELKNRYAETLMAWEVLKEMNLCPDDVGIINENIDLSPVLSLDIPPIEDNLIKELIAQKNYKNALEKLCANESGVLQGHGQIVKEGLALFEREWELLAVAAELELPEQQSVITAAFRKRSEACQKLAEARKVLLKTFDIIERVNKEKRADDLKTAPGKLTGPALVNELKKNVETNSRLVKQRSEIEFIKKEADYIEKMVVKKIQRISMVDFEGKFVSVDNGFWNHDKLIANRTIAKEREMFFLFELGDGKIVLMGCNKRVVSAERNRGGQLISDRRCPLSWERFAIQKASEGYVNIQDSNGKFVSSRLDDNKLVKACADVPDKSERFRVEYL